MGRHFVAGAAVAALLAVAGCKDAAPSAPAPAAKAAVPSGEVPSDPKTLYTVEAKAAPAKSGGEGSLHLAIRPVAGALVKEETPFRGKLKTEGPIAFSKSEFEYEDRAQVVDGGPVFELPFDAKEAGEGTIDADLTFFVCVAEACMRTTESLSVPVRVN